MARPETQSFEDTGAIPNSRLPVLVYHEVEEASDGTRCEELFARTGWLGAWLDGIFSFHHFHSTAHEVLGIVAGTATVILGGPAPVRAYIEDLLPDILEGRIEPGRVLDRVVGLDGVPDGYRAMDDREAIKVMVRP